MREQRHGHPLGDLRPRSSTADEVRDAAAGGRGRLRRRAARALDRRPRARDARARGRRDRRLRPRQPRARADGARLGAPARPRLRRTARTSSGSSCRCSGTGSSLTPSFLAETRALGRDEALERIRERCLRARAAARARLGREAPPGRPPASGRGRDVTSSERAALPARAAPAPARAAVRRAARASRRGPGSDVAGSRPYRARRPARHDRLVRLRAALGGARHATSSSSASTTPTRRRASCVVCDRRPAMALFDASLPVALEAGGRCGRRATLIVVSALAARGDVGYARLRGAAARHGEPYWLPPRAAAARCGDRASARRPRRASTRRTTRSSGRSRYLGRMRSATPGRELRLRRLGLPRPAAARRLARRRRALRWDVVPVVVQDPVWEQSFPDVGSVVVPVADPAGGGVRARAR